MRSHETEIPEFQDELEREALALLDHPQVAAARAWGEQLLLASVPQADSHSRKRLAEAAKEIALCALMNVVNAGNPLPKLRLVERPPHAIDGVEVPGNRGLVDNPDTCYRLMPVDGADNFVLEGRIRKNQPAIFELSLLSKDWRTIGNLSKRNIRIDDSGSFRVHIGYEPQEPGCQFMASADDAEMLIIRESLADWDKQQPALMQVRTLAEKADADSWCEKYQRDIVAIAERQVKRWFEQTIRLHASPWALPANTLPEPAITDEIGKLVTQAYSIGRFHLEDDQALVVTLTQGEAEYVVVPVSNIWGITEDPVNTQASLNTTQAQANPDGSFTFVVSSIDPGVHNWVDAGGLRQGFLFVRWAGISEERPADRPLGLSAHSAVCRIDALRELLPLGTTWVGPEERRSQLDNRAAAYGRRFSRPIF